MYLTQQNKILALLKIAGSSGVSSYDLTYKHNCKQAPTRISELKAKGNLIVSKRHGRSVIYILLQGSQGLTQSPFEPPVVNSTKFTPTGGYLNSWEVPMESYEKDGRTYWREIVEPKQEALI